MSRPYKALQNKVFRQGAYIGYVVAGGQQFTTNGYMMVNHVVSPEEYKVPAGQLDNRNNGQPMLDKTHIIDRLEDDEVRVHQASKGKGYQTSQGIEAQNLCHKGSPSKLAVQKVYIDYVEALFEDSIAHWYVNTDDNVAFAGSKDGNIIAVVAPLKEN
jgi:hypothetical protein